MAQVLRRLTPQAHPDLLVGTATGDDGAVWRLDDDRALVATVDFITPLVDDARTWGRIAAANAASDVYAMGGRPLLALNLVGWNSEALSTDLLVEVLEGGAAAAAEGGFVVAGGHTVDDPEPKYGLAVIGEVHPERIVTNSGLRDGDALVLTKALGVGVISTALKRGAVDATSTAAVQAVESMVRLNATASAVARDAGVSGGTDVTGFGLLGHLRKMAEASGVDVALDVSSVPTLPRVRSLIEGGFVPGGTRRNLDWAAEVLEPGGVDESSLLVLADAQTSGGLLFGAAPAEARRAADTLRQTGHAAAVIGSARSGTGRIRLRPG